MERQGRQPARWLPWTALAAAAALLTLRFLTVGPSALTFNEATYIDLARHPWWSSYYPDTVFVRHPPLASLLWAAWVAVAPATEWWWRLPSLALSLGAVVLLWAAARRLGGDGAATATALALGASWFAWAYALQVSMYPLLLLWTCLALWARAAGRDRLEAWAWTLSALTHLFGFVFLAARYWHAWPDWRAETRAAWPALLWLAVAGVVGVVANAGHGVIALGPFGQGLRTVATAAEWLTAFVRVHLVSLLVTLLLLVPPWLLLGWRGRAAWPRLALPAGVLLAFLAVGAPYPRYGLALLPLVVLAGACAPVALRDRGGASGARERPLVGEGPTTGPVRTRALLAGMPAGRGLFVAGLALALLSVPLGGVYVDSGLDPRASGDVPGRLDWRTATDRLLDAGAEGEAIVTSGSNPVAHYLQAEGFSVTDRSRAPYVLPLGHPDGRSLAVHRVDAPGEVPAGVPGAVWIVPAAWGAPSQGHDRLPLDGPEGRGTTGLAIWRPA